MNSTRNDGRPRCSWSVVGLRWATRYLLVSVVSLPFVGEVWLGELPLFAVWQLPKLAVANWLRVDVVMAFIRWAGWSSGSFSPDYILARPYALALLYVIPLLTIGSWWRSREVLWREHRSMMTAFAAMSAVDFAFTLAFGATRSLTIY